VLELAPGLVLLNREENRREDAEALESAGVRCHVSWPRDPQGAAEMVLSLGEALGTEEAAAALVRTIAEETERARLAAAGRKPLRFAYVIWRNPWMAAAAGTYVDGLLRAAGGENALASGAEPYPRIEPEELGAADPEVVLMASEPLPFTPAHLDELAVESGLPRERFRLVDGELLSWHGARTPAGLAYASALLTA
jgi:ABC-type Fe3+-hydroxamate transport system substrate-binding protein